MTAAVDRLPGLPAAIITSIISPPRAAPTGQKKELETYALDGFKETCLARRVDDRNNNIRQTLYVSESRTQS